MSTIRDLWNALRDGTKADADNGMRMRMRGTADDVRLYAAIDVETRNLALVLEVSSQIRPSDFKKIRTRTFESHLGPLPGLPDGRIALTLLLKDSAFEDLFAMLGEDLFAVLQAARNETDAVRSVTNRIAWWRKFTDRGGQRLTPEEVRGLLGELAVLARGVVRFGASAAVEAWQGGGGLRDFEFGDIAVEVKTHQAAAGASVRIGEPAQLEPARNRPLYLATLELSRAEKTGWTLAEAIDELSTQLAVDADVYEAFWNKLADQGYLPGQGELYPERYILDQALLFHVGDGFPRIACADVPSGVDAVCFSIRVAAMQPFAVPADAVLGAGSPMETLI